MVSSGKRSDLQWVKIMLNLDKISGLPWVKDQVYVGGGVQAPAGKRFRFTLSKIYGLMWLNSQSYSMC